MTRIHISQFPIPYKRYITGGMNHAYPKTYAREAAHHLLYMVANSKAMNNLMPGAIIKTDITLAEKMLLGINIGAPILMAGFAAIIILGFARYRRKKKTALSAANQE